MVRHEAAEALGAIGSPEAIPILEQYAKDSRPEVRETCEIALDRIRFFNSKKDTPQLSFLIKISLSFKVKIASKAKLGMISLERAVSCMLRLIPHLPSKRKNRLKSLNRSC
jgi:HEAT repeat protein